jgi:hypothetical protein
LSQRCFQLAVTPLRTVWWFTSAPQVNRLLTICSCPFELEIYNGVMLSVCPKSEHWDSALYLSQRHTATWSGVATNGQSMHRPRCPLHQTSYSTSSSITHHGHIDGGAPVQQSPRHVHSSILSSEDKCSSMISLHTHSANYSVLSHITARVIEAPILTITMEHCNRQAARTLTEAWLMAAPLSRRRRTNSSLP